MQVTIFLQHIIVSQHLSCGRPGLTRFSEFEKRPIIQSAVVQSSWCTRKCVAYGDHGAFRVYAPKTWNSLPTDLRCINEYNSFKNSSFQKNITDNFLHYGCFFIFFILCRCKPHWIIHVERYRRMNHYHYHQVFFMVIAQFSYQDFFRSKTSTRKCPRW